MDRSTFDFNKEILFGELGALLGAPLLSFIVAGLITSPNISSFVVADNPAKIPSIISSFAVIGAILGAAVFWLLMRAYDEKKRKELSLKHLASDISYFTPGAFVLTLLVYYPLLFLISKHLLNQDYRVLSSVILSQFVAFSLFLISINIYRRFIWKYFGKKL